jgi:transcriptional regulator with XRE-family HTH domain
MQYLYSESVISRLRQARKMAGLTLAEVASSTGYAQTTLSSVENHHDQPSTRLLAKWVNALGISETWLNTGEGEPFARSGVGDSHGPQSDLAAPIRSRIQKARQHATDLLQELDQIERELSGSRALRTLRKRL